MNERPPNDSGADGLHLAIHPRPGLHACLSAGLTMDLERISCLRFTGMCYTGVVPLKGIYAYSYTYP